NRSRSKQTHWFCPRGRIRPRGVRLLSGYPNPASRASSTDEKKGYVDSTHGPSSRTGSDATADAAGTAEPSNSIRTADATRAGRGLPAPGKARKCATFPMVGNVRRGDTKGRFIEDEAQWHD